MASRIDRTTRIPSGVASPVTTDHAAKVSVLVNLRYVGNLKKGPPRGGRPCRRCAPRAPLPGPCSGSSPVMRSASPPDRKVDVRLPGKGNSNSHGARPVHLIITMIKSRSLFRKFSSDEISFAACRFASQFKNNCFTEMCSGSEECSYLRSIDFCMTQL